MKDLPRVISAIVLLGILFLAVSFKKEGVFVLVSLFTLVALYEIVANLFKLSFVKRVLSILFFGLLTWGLIFLTEASRVDKSLVPICAVALNIILIVYLCQDSDMRAASRYVNRLFLLPALFMSSYLVSYAVLLNRVDWLYSIGLILVITYGMDTGAWFFGKNFGKNKLAPKVSPNKTVEGLIGGMLFSAFLSSLFLMYLNKEMTLLKFLLFLVFAGLSHIGDLCQSKIKREVNIKDSGRLIPGHGGVFDRVDSLYFIGPFYVIAQNLFL